MKLIFSAYEIGIVNVESEAELDSARVLIQRLLVEHNSLPYEPDKNWRFLDCKFLFKKIFNIKIDQKCTLDTLDNLEFLIIFLENCKTFQRFCLSKLYCDIFFTWRVFIFSDVSNAEEGTFRVSRQQEHVQSVSDVCNTDECLLILDHAFPSITDREAVELFQPQQPIPWAF